MAYFHLGSDVDKKMTENICGIIIKGMNNKRNDVKENKVKKETLRDTENNGLPKEYDVSCVWTETSYGI